MKKFDDDLEFESLNDEPRDTRFILPIIVVAVLLVIVIVALVLLGKNKDTSADLMSTEQSETTEAEAQTTEVMGTIEATESAEEADADDPQGSNMGNETGASVDVTALLSQVAWQSPARQRLVLMWQDIRAPSTGARWRLPGYSLP